MSHYAVVLTKSAEKELHKLPLAVIKKIVTVIGDLADNPRPVGCKKLKGFKNLWRVRMGNYRLIYAIDDIILLVEIRAVGDRKDIYE
jgi:mRNA interferase RelE/StbE